MEFIYESRKFGIPHDYFFKIQVIANNNNNITYYHLSITPIEENIYDDLFIKTVAKALGGNEAIIEKDFNNVILFKTEFHKKMFNQIKTNKKATITIKELQTKYPIINWLLFLNKLINLPELTIIENKLITLNVEDFGDLLKLILHTPKRILSNYMITRTMQYIITYLPALYNSTFKQNLKINSVQVAIESLPLAINVWYVKKYFTSITKNQVKEILTNIKNKFKDTLENTKLFDKPTKNCAINKLNAMTADIGYSEEMFNDSLIKSYYNKLQTSFGYCLDAVLSANKFKIDTNFRKLDLSLSADWNNTGIDVTKMNVYYNLETNHIVIPAAFILYTSHNQNGLNYLNYATLGFTIGQQITYGFVRGKYGLNGTLNQCWSPEITKTFEEKNQCFINQYKNFTMFNTPINSNFTLLDNIADNNGLRLAYNTYQALKSKNTEQKLPGLNFNENQMFWISYAQAQCERMTESYFIQHAQYESRVPQACRITGTLSNMENFAKDFNCKVNAPMNPIKKCTVWCLNSFVVIFLVTLFLNFANLDRYDCDIPEVLVC
ncbi:hypothetical protein RN001_004780 [Aquatica leii]|uniref:Uncharacterized protein n=1 Tax=Aquatica leii TaxID=1421715 RepID=A0AAN7SA90_9COLE|nr:hypothetical protein RN001_004780 [Aquatica leii]